MSNRIERLVLGVALVGTNLYWWLRERTVRKALGESRNWTEEARGRSAGRDVPTAAVERAADVLDTRPEELPDRVATLDGKVRDLQKETERLREEWADSWWDAIRQSPRRGTGPRIVPVFLDRGTLPDTRALANAALQDEWSVAVVFGNADQTFTVSVGEEARETYDAAALAEDIAAVAGDGGAGGDARIASGGTEDELPPISECLPDRVRDVGIEQ